MAARPVRITGLRGGAGSDNSAPLDLAPDGKRFVVFLAPESPGGRSNLHVTFLLNFFDELKRRIP